MNRVRATVVGVALAVALATVVLHAPAVSNGFTHWDDNLYLEKVAQVGGLSWPMVRWAFTTTEHFYYHPLTWLSHALDYRLWGLKPAGHHAISVALHGLNTALVVVVAWSLLGWVEEFGAGQRLAGAAGVGLVFGIHPLQVEAVAWVAERKTLLCALFMLASTCAYLQAVRAPGSRAWHGAVIGLFLAALLAKPMAVTLPGVLLILDFYPLRRWPTLGWARVVREKVPLLALSVAAAAGTVVAQSQVGALAGFTHLGVLARCLVAVRGVVFYLWKLLWPAWLSPFYPLGGNVTLAQKEFFVPVVAFGIVSVLSLWLQRRAPALLAAWLTFLVLLLPNLGLLQAGGQAVADRFMYVAMVPVLLVIAAACVWFWRRAPAVGRIGLVGLLGCELVLLAWRTRGQLPVWHDDVTLWQAVVRQFPDSTTEYRFVAQGLIEQRRFEEALPYAREAAARLPADQLARSELALVYRELAGTRAEQGRFEEAFAFASDAVRLNPDDPSARSLFGYVLLKTGHSADAAQQCREALRLDASLPAARYNLACAYAQLGRLAEARTALDQAVALNPRLAAVAARDPELAALHN